MTLSDTRLLLCVLAYIGCNVVGDLSLSHGLRQMGPFAGAHPAGLLRFLLEVATTPAVIIGTALEAGAYGIFLSMLSEADLSLVVPAGAGTYILIALLSLLLQVIRSSFRREWARGVILAGGKAIFPAVEPTPLLPVETDGEQPVLAGLAQGRTHRPPIDRVTGQRGHHARAALSRDAWAAPHSSSRNAS